MKITAQEEYGLRILIRIAGCKDSEGLSIPQLSEAEGLSSHYVAKLCRILRMADFINSTPGNKGGYILTKPAENIIIKNVLDALGGRLFDLSFCGDHSGIMRFCTNSVDCSARSLWSIIQLTMDKLLLQITLADLIGNTEQVTSEKFQELLINNPVK
ncbi:MAG: RrF2 family transcriptional regulator [Niabella sp.]